ncbi:NAD-dependent epimerase/dehydratase family protein [Acidobacteria bacterium AH-259-G07]|nr:NAD-dependent epimerase/dehydratase family protein [Acidobacteria bacterium AH-259-G07]
MFKREKVLVTGGTGMIGRYLVELLLERGAKVRVVSLDGPDRVHEDTEFIRANLMDLNNCLRVCKEIDYVFHLAGVKGSPEMAQKQPASFFVPLISFNTNMMEAARRCGVKHYLYTSSVAVYGPAEVLREADVWKTFPSENDWFAGWAKRIGELQAQAYAIEYGWKNVSIVRPPNVYGRYDNFHLRNAMVIPSLIKRVFDGENPLLVWGDGSAVRDFIHAKDVATGMLFAVENGITEPLNLGSGEGVSIERIIEIILDNVETKPDVVWDTTKPSGDEKRVMDMTRAMKYGFRLKIPIEEGIRDTVEWYSSHKDQLDGPFNVFVQGIDSG